MSASQWRQRAPLRSISSGLPHITDVCKSNWTGERRQISAKVSLVSSAFRRDIRARPKAVPAGGRTLCAPYFLLRVEVQCCPRRSRSAALSIVSIQIPLFSYRTRAAATPSFSGTAAGELLQCAQHVWRLKQILYKRKEARSICRTGRGCDDECSVNSERPQPN